MRQHNLFLISGNPGAGKTTIARNLAYALQHFGYSVLVVDGDIQTPKLSHYLGEKIPKRTIQDVLTGKRTLRTAFYKDSAGINYLLTSARDSNTAHPSKLIDRIHDLADVVLITAPMHDAIWHAIGIPTILVTQADFPSILNLHRFQKIIKTQGIVLNRVHGDETEMTPRNIIEFTHSNVLASVPQTREIRSANHKGQSLLQTQPDNPASLAIKKLAANLMNLEYQPEKQKPILAKLGLLKRDETPRTSQRSM